MMILPLVKRNIRWRLIVTVTFVISTLGLRTASPQQMIQPPLANQFAGKSQREMARRQLFAAITHSAAVEKPEIRYAVIAVMNDSQRFAGRSSAKLNLEMNQIRNSVASLRTQAREGTAIVGPKEVNDAILKTLRSVPGTVRVPATVIDELRTLASKGKKDETAILVTALTQTRYQREYYRTKEKYESDFGQGVSEWEAVWDYCQEEEHASFRDAVNLFLAANIGVYPSQTLDELKNNLPVHIQQQDMARQLQAITEKLEEWDARMRDNSSGSAADGELDRLKMDIHNEIEKAFVDMGEQLGGDLAEVNGQIKAFLAEKRLKEQERQQRADYERGYTARAATLSILGSLGRIYAGHDQEQLKRVVQFEACANAYLRLERATGSFLIDMSVAVLEGTRMAGPGGQFRHRCVTVLGAESDLFLREECCVKESVTQ